MERKEQERKKSQKLEFTPGGVQSGNVLPTSKINIPTPGTRTLQHITLSNSARWFRFSYYLVFYELIAVSGVLNLAPATSDTARDGRQNKKSKWDKVLFYCK